MLERQIARLYGTVELRTSQFDQQLTRVEQRLQRFQTPLTVRLNVQAPGLQQVLQQLQAIRGMTATPFNARVNTTQTGARGGPMGGTSGAAPFLQQMAFGGVAPGRGGTFFQPSAAPHFMAGMPLQSNVVGMSPHAAAMARSQQIFNQNAARPAANPYSNLAGFNVWANQRAQNRRFFGMGRFFGGGSSAIGAGGGMGGGGGNSPLAMRFGGGLGSFGVGAAMGFGMPFALNPAMAGGALGAMGLKRGFGEAISTEAREATLQRVTGFTPDQTKEASRGLSQLAVEKVGATREQTFGLAEIAGRAGTFTNPQELISLTRLLTEIQAVVPEMQPENLANQFVRLNNVFDNTIDETEAVANALVAVDTASTASAKELLDVASRLAPVTQLVGGTANQTVAFAGALREAGIAGERGSTAAMRVFKNLSTDTATFASALQMPEQDLTQALGDSPFLAFQMIAERINELTTKGPERLDFLASELGLKNVRDLELVGKFSTPRIQGKFQEFLKTTEQQEAQPTALSQAQELQAGTTAGSLEKLGDATLQLADAGFRPLLPLVDAFAEGLTTIASSHIPAVMGFLDELNQELGGLAGSEGIGDLLGDIYRGIALQASGEFKPFDFKESNIFNNPVGRALLGPFLDQERNPPPAAKGPDVFPDRMPSAMTVQTVQQGAAARAALKTASQQRALDRLQAARDRGDPNAEALAAQLAAMGVNVPGAPPQPVPPGANTRGMFINPLQLPTDKKGILQEGFFKGLSIPEAQQVQVNARGDIGAFGRQFQNEALGPLLQEGTELAERMRAGFKQMAFGGVALKGPLGIFDDKRATETFEHLVEMSPEDIRTAREIFKKGTDAEKRQLGKSLGLPEGFTDVGVLTGVEHQPGLPARGFGVFHGNRPGAVLDEESPFLGRTGITDTMGGMAARQQDILQSHAEDLQKEANQNLEDIVKNTGELVKAFTNLALPAFLR